MCPWEEADSDDVRFEAKLFIARIFAEDDTDGNGLHSLEEYLVNREDQQESEEDFFDEDLDRSSSLDWQEYHRAFLPQTLEGIRGGQETAYE